MNALVYLELRYAAHNAAAVLRSPWRLLLWIAYLLFVGAGLVTRIAVRSRPLAFGPQHGASIVTMAGPIAGMLVLSIGMTTISAALGRVTTFRTRAEAMLFSNAGITPLTTALWLQVRRIASTFGRRLMTLGLYFVVFAPQRFGSPAQTLWGLAGVLGAIAFLLGLELPVYLLAQRGWGRVLIVAGGAVALYGAAYAAASFAVLAIRPAFVLAFLRAAPVDLGAFGRAIVAGNPLALGGLVAAVLLLVAAALALGNDALPELYAAAERSPGVRDRARARRRRKPLIERARSSERVPAGAFAIVWKDWLAAKRGRGALQAWSIGALASIGLGAGIALTLDASGATGVAGPLFGAAFGFLLLAPSGTARGLAADFGKPLWWLGTSSLRSRVHALVFARAWRGGAVLTLGLVAAALALGDVRLALAVPVGGFALWWSLGALGAALYALFPFDVDRRGPMLLVRTAVVAAYAGPVAAGAIVLALAGVPFPLVVLAAAAALTCEGFAAVEVAALRIAENGAMLANLDRVS